MVVSGLAFAAISLYLVLISQSVASPSQKMLLKRHRLATRAHVQLLNENPAKLNDVLFTPRHFNTASAVHPAEEKHVKVARKKFKSLAYTIDKDINKQCSREDKKEVACPTPESDFLISQKTLNEGTSSNYIMNDGASGPVRKGGSNLFLKSWRFLVKGWRQTLELFKRAVTKIFGTNFAEGVAREFDDEIDAKNGIKIEKKPAYGTNIYSQSRPLSRKIFDPNLTSDSSEGVIVHKPGVTYPEQHDQKSNLDLASLDQKNHKADQTAHELNVNVHADKRSHDIQKKDGLDINLVAACQKLRKVKTHRHGPPSPENSPTPTGKSLPGNAKEQLLDRGQFTCINLWFDSLHMEDTDRIHEYPPAEM